MKSLLEFSFWLCMGTSIALNLIFIFLIFPLKNAEIRAQEKTAQFYLRALRNAIEKSYDRALEELKKVYFPGDKS